jgi:hypothetical protein
MREIVLDNGTRQYTVYSKDGRILIVTTQYTLAAYVASKVARCRPGETLVIGGR